MSVTRLWITDLVFKASKAYCWQKKKLTKEVNKNIRYGEITYSNYIYYFHTRRRSLVKINDYCH